MVWIIEGYRLNEGEENIIPITFSVFLDKYWAKIDEYILSSSKQTIISDLDKFILSLETELWWKKEDRLLYILRNVVDREIELSLISYCYPNFYENEDVDILHLTWYMESTRPIVQKFSSVVSLRYENINSNLVAKYNEKWTEINSSFWLFIWSISSVWRKESNYQTEQFWCDLYSQIYLVFIVYKKCIGDENLKIQDLYEVRINDFSEGEERLTAIKPLIQRLNDFFLAFETFLTTNNGEDLLNEFNVDLIEVLERHLKYPRSNIWSKRKEILSD